MHLQSRWTENKAEGEVCGCRETVCPSVRKEKDRNEEAVAVNVTDNFL